MEYDKLMHSRDHLNSKCQKIENEYRIALQQERDCHSEDVERLTKMNERVRQELESEREELIHRYNMERDDLIQNYEQDKQELAQEIMAIQRERDDSLLMAENDKQQCLNLLEQEKCVVNEKLLKVQYELQSVESELERLKKESYNRQEQDKQHIISLSNELKAFRSQFEEKW